MIVAIEYVHMTLMLHALQTTSVLVSPGLVFSHCQYCSDNKQINNLTFCTTARAPNNNRKRKSL